MKRWLLYAGAVAAVALLVYPLVAAIAHNGLLDATTASWAQAVGTIAAVGVAVWAGQIPARQLVAERRARREAFLTGLEWAAIYALGAVADMRAKVRAKDWRDLGALSVQYEAQSSEGLRRFLAEPISTWPAAYLFVEADRMMKLIETFHSLVMQEAPTAHANNPWPTLQTWEANLAKAEGDFWVSFKGV